MQSSAISQLTSNIDTAELKARFETLRKSEYFPAVLGAAAGGVTALVVAGLISGRKSGTTVKYVEAGDQDKEGRGHETMFLGFTLGEIMQLVTVVTQLARQLRDWRDQSQY